MGQGEILELLEKQIKPLSRTEIAALLNQNSCGISHQLRILIKHNEVKVIEIDRNQAKAFFQGKAPSRRMRLYYI